MATEHVDNSRVTVICNARKSVRKAQQFAQQLRDRGLSVEVVVTASVGEGDREARRAVAAGVPLLIAAGGDGTVRSVLGALAESNATLGVLPIGTANDLALELGIRSVHDAVAAVLASRARAWDLGAATYRGLSGLEERGYFCSTAGAGGLARVMAMAQTRLGELLTRILGNAVWPILVLASWCVTRATTQRVLVNGVAAERRMKVLEIAKLRAIGGISVTPDARGDSGMLHVWLAHAPNVWTSAKLIYQGLSGSSRHLMHADIEYFSREPKQNHLGITHVTRIGLDGGPALPVHLNGDYVGTTPATFELTSSTFRVLAAPELAGEAVRVVPQRERSLRNSIPVPSSPRSGLSR